VAPSRARALRAGERGAGSERPARRRDTQDPRRPPQAEAQEALRQAQATWRQVHVDAASERRQAGQVTADPFSVQERNEAGVHVIAVAGELDIATAPELC